MTPSRHDIGEKRYYSGGAMGPESPPDVGLLNQSDFTTFSPNAWLLANFNGTPRAHPYTKPPIFWLIDKWDIYIVPFILLVGIFGNLLSFTVFIKTYLRRQSSSIYLAALAIADAAYLCCVLFSWAQHIGIKLYERNGLCQTFVYITHVSGFLSVWYVVSFTTERYIAVSLPLRRQDLCTTWRAKIVVAALGAISMIIYVPQTWTNSVNTMKLGGVTYRACGPMQKYYILTYVSDNIDTMITLIIPFIGIVFMNIKISYKVIKFYKKRKLLNFEQYNITYRPTTTERSQLQGHINTKSKTQYTRTQVRVTKMLLIVSTFFIAMNMPRHIARVYTFIQNIVYDNYQHSPSLIMWQKLFNNIYHLNFSVNVFLYSLCGKNFKKALLWYYGRVKHNLHEAAYKYTGRGNHSSRQNIVMREYKPDSQFV